MLEGGEISIFAASFAVVAALLYLRRGKQKELLKDDGKHYPPPLPVLPVLGTIIRGGMTALPAHFMKAAEKHGPIYSFTMGKRLVVVLNSYEAIFDGMHRHSEAFADRVAFFTEKKVMNPELRGIIYVHYNEKYRKNHKITLTILREFGYGIQGVSETRILAEVETMNVEIRKQNGRPFDPKWLFTYAVSNVVFCILFGKSFMQSSSKDYDDIVKGSAECIENLDMALNLAEICQHLPMYWKTIDGLRSGIKNLLRGIDAGIDYIKAHNSEPTFVSRYLELLGSGYDHQDLRFVLRDLSFGSTDTMSTTILWAVVELANHPEVQKRFQRELDEVIPDGRLPSLDDKPRLPYTEAVILEVMRHKPLVPFFVPHRALKDTTVLEFDIPKGTMVIPNGYSAHMDEKFWKDPENFRPERFLDADNQINMKYSKRVIAFGLGKRSCIGQVLGRQSVFLFITNLAQQFDIRPPEGQKLITVKEVSSVVTFPTPYDVRLIPRKKPTKN